MSTVEVKIEEAYAGASPVLGRAALVRKIKERETVLTALREKALADTETLRRLMMAKTLPVVALDAE
jgi:hypothetical protein